VRREIDDASIRASMEACLRRDAPQVRRAATVALRHSLAAPDARSAFADALATEAADVVAQELGESLVQAARASPDAAERSRIHGLVLRRAGDDSLDGLRFRVEDDLAIAPLGVEERRTLADLAGSAQSYAKRAFALTVLAAGATAAGDEAVREVRNLLVQALGHDPDSAVRDLAARLLVRVPADEATIAVLARTGREDPQWNVRYSAIETLIRTAAPEIEH